MYQNTLIVINDLGDALERHRLHLFFVVYVGF